MDQADKAQIERDKAEQSEHQEGALYVTFRELRARLNPYIKRFFPKDGRSASPEQEVQPTIAPEEPHTSLERKSTEPRTP